VNVKKFIFHLHCTPWQIIVHIGAWIPGIVLVYEYLAGHLSINPIQDATRRLGLWAMIFLLASLACTPANTYLGFRQALKLRRPIGLYAFVYALAHLYLFLGVDYGFDLGLVWLDVNSKPYIFVGAGSITILLILAFTSFDSAKKRLGKIWNQLHRLVYLAGPLVILHYAWVKKDDLFRLTGEVGGPLVAALILIVLLVIRLPAIRRFVKQRQ
jgi:sulfoxide reductase heme-binding subunit YedZ